MVELKEVKVAYKKIDQYTMVDLSSISSDIGGFDRIGVRFQQGVITPDKPAVGLLSVLQRQFFSD